MTTHDQDIAAKIAHLEDEDRHVAEVIDAAKALIAPKPHATFADPDTDAPQP